MGVFAISVEARMAALPNHHSFISMDVGTIQKEFHHLDSHSAASDPCLAEAKTFIFILPGA
jgi:hypothetical protein